MKNLLKIFFLLTIPAILLSEDKFDTHDYSTGVGLYGNFNNLGLGFQSFDGSYGSFRDDEAYEGTGFGLTGGLFSEIRLTGKNYFTLDFLFNTYGGDAEDFYLGNQENFEFSLSYLSANPGFKAYLTDHFALQAGLSLNFLMNSEYQYSFNNVADEIRSGSEIPQMNRFALGFRAGAGYDFEIDEYLFLSPYIGVDYLFNQRGQSYNQLDQNSFDDIWSTLSLKAGVSVSFRIFPEVTGDTAQPEKEKIIKEDVDAVYNENLEIGLTAPIGGLIRERVVEEHFPLLNYVFFDGTDDEIPDRYRKLEHVKAEKFDADSMFSGEPFEISSVDMNNIRMNAYYNILNIIGDRLRKNPAAQLTLRASDPIDKGSFDIAEEVKDYLLDVFDISSRRIKTFSTEMPLHNSIAGPDADASDQKKLSEENRRVEFLSTDPNILAPVIIRSRDENVLDNFLIFNITSVKGVDFWRIDMLGQNDTISFGPYINQDIVKINTENILRGANSKVFTASVIVKKINDEYQKKDIAFNLQKQESSDSKAYRLMILYDKFRVDTVSYNKSHIHGIIFNEVDKSRLIIHAHTDDIGSAVSNKALSDELAEQIRLQLREEMMERKVWLDMKSYGFGEDFGKNIFDNSTPEGRFYNRSIVIEAMTR